MANKLYIKVPVLRKGKLKYRKVQNIGKVKGVDTFLVDQQYAFQCSPFADSEESMTIIRMTIPAGTPVMQGYNEVLESLHKMGYDAVKVCEAMGFDEVVYGAGFCSEATSPERLTCDQYHLSDTGSCYVDCPHARAFIVRS